MTQRRKAFLAPFLANFAPLREMQLYGNKVRKSTDYAMIMLICVICGLE
jgi:hypothetical protein